MSLPIVHYNSPVLRQKGEKITVFDSALAQLAAAMIETMHTAGGIGLAAQQIGRALQLCVLDLRETQRDFSWRLDGAQPPLDLFMPLIVVNPVITVKPDTDDYIVEEGCLSFPDIRGDVVRPDVIAVRYQDERGTAHELVCDGLLSRCLQHEYDHLQGTLFIDRMTKKVRNALDRAVKELAQRTREETQPPGS